MTSHRTLRKHAFVMYAIIVCGAVILYLLKIPWEENIKIMLNHYPEISYCFLIPSCGLILFRLIAFIQKGTAPETRKVRLFGPIIDLSIAPLFDASLFYSALFLLNTIFEKRMHGLALDAFFILLGVALILLYQSINDLIKLGRETFYAQKGEKIITTSESN